MTRACSTMERELQALLRGPPEEVDTTLLIHPGCLMPSPISPLSRSRRCRAAHAAAAGRAAGASFHPDYVFADTDPDDITNCTNRSPFPTLHLLREASLDRAVTAFPDAAAIYERNLQTLRELGHDGWRQLGVGAPRATGVGRRCPSCR
jgi:hypothetical protein